MSETSINVHLQSIYFDEPTGIRAKIGWLGGNPDTKTVVMDIHNVCFFLDRDQADEIVKTLAFDVVSLPKDDDA